MNEGIMSILKDNSIVDNFFILYVVLIVVLLILKPILKLTKSQTKAFDRILIFINISFILLVIESTIITKNYNRLWLILFVVITILLKKILPKFGKWYDKKVDDLIDKI